jgi:DNA-binding CsgD family transcriptional regulator
MLLGEGLTNKEIASALGKSVPTIRNHVAAILDKSGMPGRGRFIALFHRTTLGPEYASVVPFPQPRI